MATFGNWQPPKRDIRPKIVTKDGRVLRHAHGDSEFGEPVRNGDQFTIPVTLWTANPFKNR